VDKITKGPAEASKAVCLDYKGKTGKKGKSTRGVRQRKESLKALNTTTRRKGFSVTGGKRRGGNGKGEDSAKRGFQGTKRGGEKRYPKSSLTGGKT